MQGQKGAIHTVLMYAHDSFLHKDSCTTCRLQDTGIESPVLESSLSPNMPTKPCGKETCYHTTHV